MVFPTILGRGKRLFPEGIDRLKLKLVEARQVGPDGVQVQIYGGTPREGAKQMDQPTAENALKELEPLVGEWSLEAIPPGGPPWPGEGHATFEWMEGAPFLIERSTVEGEAPDEVTVIGCDAANGTYFQLYSDERNVCRVYEMSIGDGEWNLWREGEPFGQRFTGRFSEDGNRIDGREIKTESGWESDFDLNYVRVGSGR